MIGRNDDADEGKTVPDYGSWRPSIHTPDDTEKPTRMVTDRPAPRPAPPPIDDQDDPDEGRTRIFKEPSATAAATGDLSRAPVGWVVIVDGPGRGNAYPLYYGSNRIGRGTGIEVSLNHGDESISRGPHARVTYDPKGRSFYLQPGEGTGLTYKDGAPVLTPVPLESHAQVEIGHTTLRFVPLCGQAFDWMDTSKGAAQR